MKKDGGFTLIEVVMVTALLGLVMTAVYTFYISGAQSWRRGVARMDHQQNARVAMDRMVKELRFAGWVEIPEGTEGEIHYRFLTDPAELVRRFRLVGQELVFETIVDSATTAHTKIAMEITALSFTLDAARTLHITINTGVDLEKFTLKSSVRPKNLPPEEG